VHTKGYSINLFNSMNLSLRKNIKKMKRMKMNGQLILANETQFLWSKIRNHNLGIYRRDKEMFH